MIRWLTRCALSLATLLCVAHAHAGHELPFYPGYYPQEIRLDTVAPGAAAAKLARSELHAYVGGDPLSGRNDPTDIRSVESFGTYVVLTFNPASSLVKDRESRCESARRIVKTLASPRGGYIVHPYPVTPYDPDYLEHFDLAQSTRRAYDATPPTTSPQRLRIRTRGPLAEKLATATARGTDARWDVALEEVSLDSLLDAHRVALDGWSGPPWLKHGWFHAYLLHAAAISDRARRESVEALYRRLATGAYTDRVEAIDLERSLVRELVAGCERVVAGFTTKRERFNAEFSKGIENVAYDSQTGLGSAVFVRTAKLKDFPWNGWLHLGLATRASAAWNPIAGFSDPAGRLLWSAVGDPAMLPSPYGGGWVANRVTPESVTMDASGLAVPEDALVPDDRTGVAREVGNGKTATVKITYRVRASAFHDDTRMTPADAVYPYLFAFKWGAKGLHAGAHYDPSVDAATALVRRALVGFKVVKVDSEVKKYGDITFTYVVPVVEVYLRSVPLDAEQVAALAPPWSPVPWHLVVLMEEAVKRGLGAFSAEEARRRGVRWLDLARDAKLKEALAALVEGFAKEAYVPEALKRFVTADEAHTRWTALKQFVQRRRHFLVTSGPYRLDKWAEGSVTMEVFRDFTNPMGVGSFDRFALPRRAYVTGFVSQADRLEVHAEVERVEKFLRDHRVVREPLAVPRTDDDRADLPRCRYVVVASDGTVAAAGVSRETVGNRLVVDLKGKLRPGFYTAMVALSLGDNEVDLPIATTQYRVEGSP